MNDDLLARAVEAASKAYYEHLAGLARMVDWEDMRDEAKDYWRVPMGPAVRAVFGVIADHADRQVEAIIADLGRPRVARGITAVTLQRFASGHGNAPLPSREKGDNPMSDPIVVVRHALHEWHEPPADPDPCRTENEHVVHRLRDHGLLADQYERVEVNDLNAVSWVLGIIQRGVPVFVRKEP